MSYQNDTELESWERRYYYLKEVKITMIALIDKEIGSCEDNMERYKMDKRNWENRQRKKLLKKEGIEMCDTCGKFISGNFVFTAKDEPFKIKICECDKNDS